MKRRWEKSAFGLLSMFFFVFSGFLHPLFHTVPHAICGLMPEPMWHQAPSPDWDVHFHHSNCPVCVGIVDFIVPVGFHCDWAIAGEAEKSGEPFAAPPAPQDSVHRPRAPPGVSAAAQHYVRVA